MSSRFWCLRNKPVPMWTITSKPNLASVGTIVFNSSLLKTRSQPQQTNCVRCAWKWPITRVATLRPWVFRTFSGAPHWQIVTVGRKRSVGICANSVRVDRFSLSRSTVWRNRLMVANPVFFLHRVELTTALLVCPSPRYRVAAVLHRWPDDLPAIDWCESPPPISQWPTNPAH